MDLDLATHKEFRFRRDGRFVAVGMGKPGSDAKPEVCVIRTADGHRFELPDITYDFGGHRLELDCDCTLFSGAYHRTGIAAHDFETKRLVWERRDLKQLGKLAYDALENVLYCFCERRAFLLNASNGKERSAYRGLTNAFFGKDPSLAVFEAADVKLQNRATKSVHLIPKATKSILRVAFIESAAVLSWVGGPVTAYDPQTGELIWEYQPEGAHVYSVAPASDHQSVWLAEQPGYKEHPWHRLRLLSSTGDIKQEVRCALGHSFALAPYLDSVIRGNLVVTPIANLGSE